MPTNADLEYLLKLPLERKIAVTQTRLLEFCHKEKAYLSYSGGKDSTVLLHIIRKMVAARLIEEIPIIYINPYYERNDMRAWMQQIGGVTTIKSPITPRQVIKEHGYPIISKQVSGIIYQARNAKTIEQYDRYISGGNTKADILTGKNKAAFNSGVIDKYKPFLNAPFMISPKCCDCLKKIPVHEYEKEAGRSRITGTTCEESRLRRLVWLKNGCNTFGKSARSNPISFWTEQDILKYLYVFNVPLHPCYGQIVNENGKYRTTGESRTGCTFCLFGAHLGNDQRFIKLGEENPKLLDFCLNKLGFANVIDWIHSHTELRYNMPAYTGLNKR